MHLLYGVLQNLRLFSVSPFFNGSKRGLRQRQPRVKVQNPNCLNMLRPQTLRKFLKLSGLIFLSSKMDVMISALVTLRHCKEAPNHSEIMGIKVLLK